MVLRPCGAVVPPVVLGVDERTAAVWERGEWHVGEPGRVTVTAGESTVSAGAGPVSSPRLRPGSPEAR
jgi:hypothetical protein